MTDVVNKNSADESEEKQQPAVILQTNATKVISRVSAEFSAIFECNDHSITFAVRRCVMKVTESDAEVQTVASKFSDKLFSFSSALH